MAKMLQHFDFRRSNYERPYSNWVCGRLAEGCPCQIGPDASGRCRGGTECQPICRDKRWFCTRSELAGAACAEGPNPDGSCCRQVPLCRPVRGWRNQLRTTSRWAAALTIGILLLLLGGSSRTAFINPGELTFQHSRIGSCAGCHTSFAKSAFSWPRLAFTKSFEVAESQTCLTCHALGDDAFNPHNMPVEGLEAMTKRAGKRTSENLPLVLKVSQVLITPKYEADGALPCAVCHQEHNGQTASLTKISNQTCMTCHVSAFNSLASGHPKFDNYPFKRRTRINFDHTKHFQTNFHDKNIDQSAVPSLCISCHQSDTQGSTMQVRKFEQVCAACHADQIEGVARASAKGIQIYSVPGLDVESMMDKDIAIGFWPVDSENEVTPFMDIFLAGDADYVEARNILKDTNLLDLTDASEEVLVAVEKLVWAIKEFYLDLTVKGVAGLKLRLEAALGRKISQSEFSHLTGLLPVDSIRLAQRQWFPGLAREMALHRSGNVVPDPDTKEEPVLIVPEQPASTVQEDTMGPAQESDDLTSGELLENEGDLESVGDLTSEGLLENEGKLETSHDAKLSTGAPSQVEDIDLPEPVSGEEWSAAGGWYKDEFVISYRPVGHGDKFLKVWLDIAGKGTGAEGKSAAAAVFEVLAKPKGPGRCVKCHSIDKNTNDAGTHETINGEGVGGKDAHAIVNWRGAQPLMHAQKFTTFSHTSHFPLLDEKGCTSCHSLNEKADFISGYKDRDFRTFTSNFNLVSKDTCAECHSNTRTSAGDNCITCHNYHIGKFTPTVPGAPIVMTKKEKRVK